MSRYKIASRYDSNAYVVSRWWLSGTPRMEVNPYRQEVERMLRNIENAGKEA